jgi:hypothetical protein
MGSSINARAASSLSGFMSGASTASQASLDAGLRACASRSLSLLPLLSAPLLGGLLLLRPART